MRLLQEAAKAARKTQREADRVAKREAKEAERRARIEARVLKEAKKEADELARMERERRGVEVRHCDISELNADAPPGGQGGEAAVERRSERGRPRRARDQAEEGEVNIYATFLGMAGIPLLDWTYGYIEHILVQRCFLNRASLGQVDAC